MRSAPINAVRVLAKLDTFGPARQSFEITNGSKDELTVHLERLGSEHFRIPASSQKMTLKPGASARAHVEFDVAGTGMVMTLRAVYEAVIQVWAVKQGKKATKELVDLVRVTGTGPGFISTEDLHCFDRTGSSDKRKS